MSLTLLQFSDTHLGGSAKGAKPDPADAFRSLVAAWQATGRPADLVVLSGDIADDGSAQGCALAAELVAPLGAQVLAVTGNHDTREAVHQVFGADSEFSGGGWRVLGVDTEIPQQVQGRLEPEAVVADLDRDAGTPTLLVTHHPLIAPSANAWFQLEGADRLLGALSVRDWVKGALSGHLHQPFDWSLDFGGHQLRLIGAPSTWYSLRHTDQAWTPDPATPTGAVVLTLGDDGSVAAERFPAGRRLDQAP